ncbi:MAG TPA: type II toxin-antitoxin system ParD family antitoxin [Stellaceae bacterium]|nr:type II toxin-antitoxin system ParD family antitoxin [Stellaceae bacterium]
MSRIEKLSIAVPVEMAAELRAAVEAGEYSSVSEVIRDALRDWRLRRKFEALEVDELRRLVQEGINSGDGIEADVVFAQLRARYGAPKPK